MQDVADGQVSAELPAAEISDKTILDLLRERGSLGVTDLIPALGVTSTAVRQRLSRLMANGLVERETIRAIRGRPHHRYKLTEKGRRQTGSNFGDLAMALWKEIREIKDPEVRSGLLQRVAKSLGTLYAPQVSGTTTAERMQAVSRIFGDRDVPVAVEGAAELPVLTVKCCPYPELAEQDRTICAVEKMLFSDLIGESVKLTDYRLAGASCCRFETM